MTDNERKMASLGKEYAEGASKADIFMVVYEKALRELVAAEPSNFPGFHRPGFTPESQNAFIEGYVAQFRIHLPTLSVDNKGRAFRLACARLGIKSSFKAVGKFLDENGGSNGA